MKNWISRRADDVGRTTAPPMPMPGLIWRWLVSRGITTQEQIGEFFTPKLGALAHPFQLKDLDKAVARLNTAFEKQEPVCVYGDYDLDGSSGIALLVAGLKGLGFQNVSFYQPSRFLEGYGIHREALDVIAKRGDKVVISVDCGITAIEEALHAKELNLDLIITDHHLARQDERGELLPDALAVVNPNQAQCKSGLTYISGVGVGFYLLMGLKTVLKNSDFDLKSLLDLFAIGTITDMVPLKKENRVLVKHGLKVLSQTKRPGLQALIQRLGLLGRDIDSMDVSFTIAPKLNALSRLELGIRPLDVFMCENFSEAEVLAERVLELNEKRKALQSDLEEKILSQVGDEKDGFAMVLAAPGHAGVVGLVATKLSQATNKPSFVVAYHSGKEGVEGIGSARGREEDMLPAALASAAPFLDRYGGHAQAAGFSLKPENFEKFKTAILRHYEEKSSKREEASPEKVFDVEAGLEEFNENFMNWLKHAGPFGSENPAPLFKLTVNSVSGVRWLKGQHLKLTLKEGDQQVDALAFFASNQEDYKVEVGEKIELLAEPSWNYFRGERRLQLMIRDLRRCTH